MPPRPASSFQTTVAGNSNLGSHPRFPAQTGADNLYLAKGGVGGQDAAPDPYSWCKHASQGWDHGAQGGSVEQLSEDLRPNEGQVSTEKVLTKHAQLSGP